MNSMMTPQDSAIVTCVFLLIGAVASGVFEILKLNRVFACWSMMLVLAGFTAATVHTATNYTAAIKAEHELISQPDANLTVGTKGSFVSLERGEPVCATGNTVWTELPKELEGAAFWRHSDFQQGKAVFSVEHSGAVYLAATCRWLHDEQGSARDKLVRNGWSYVGKAKSSDLDWEIFRRECAAGEKFAIQTELYTAPVPILAAKIR